VGDDRKRHVNGQAKEMEGIGGSGRSPVDDQDNVRMRRMMNSSNTTPTQKEKAQVIQPDRRSAMS
jgi:hypothetical protein